MSKFPFISDGETSIEFKLDGLKVDSPAFEETVFIPLNELRRNALLIKINTDNMYDLIDPLIRKKKLEELC